MIISCLPHIFFCFFSVLGLDFIWRWYIVDTMTIKILKDKIIDKAFSYKPKQINPAHLNDAVWTIERLADVIEQQNGFDKRGLTKSQRRACEIVGEEILRNLNKGLTIIEK